jgi:hypothetical protein
MALTLGMQPMTPNDARSEDIGSVIGTEEVAPLQDHLKEVLEGDAFKGSHRSGQFLKHVVDRAIAGRFDCLKERVIGVEVFGRSPSYDTGTDAIVRVTASDVRKRLLQHYGRPGTPPEFRISLPSGSYIPKITHEPRHHMGGDPPAVPTYGISDSSPHAVSATATSSLSDPNKLRWLVLGLLFTAVNLGVWFFLWNSFRPAESSSTSTPLWSAFFSVPHPTKLITSDPNIAEIQGFTGGQISLSDYANHTYVPNPNLLTPDQKHFCFDVLRGDKASSVDTPIAVNVAQLAATNSKKISVFSARSIQLSDLQTDENLIFLGSPRSNPWFGLFDSHLDFRFEFDRTSGKEIIRNVHPRPGELPSYVASAPGWATGQSFAIIAFIQNPDQNGQVLLLAGENGEGTEAAGRLVVDLPRLASTLKRCGISPSGPSQHFELLLHLNTMAGSPSNVDAAACHIL